MEALVESGMALRAMLAAVAQGAILLLAERAEILAMTHQPVV